MAKQTVNRMGITIRLACTIFRISQTSYRYEAKTRAENEQIADWLIRLTDNHRNWGFGLCFQTPPTVAPASRKLASRFFGWPAPWRSGAG